MSDEATVAVRCYDIALLLQSFESLGENCDFGVVQRAAGIEPLGLFRFAACDAMNIITLLHSGLEGFGEPEDLWLEATGSDREFRIRSRRFAFSAHTGRYETRDDPDLVMTSQLTQMRFLKARLIKDLTQAKKIFVFKGQCDPDHATALAAALQQYGRNSLLWVTVADLDHPPGSVAGLSETLLRGFVSRAGTYDGDPSLPVEEWNSVCTSAYRFFSGLPPPTAVLDDLLAEASKLGACQWSSGQLATTSPVLDGIHEGAVVLEHRLREEGLGDVCRVDLPIIAGGSVVFSAWIRIPEGSRITWVAAQVFDAPALTLWKADVKSRARWQRVWGTAHLPLDANNASCGIAASGSTNDVFHSACWCVERGHRPLGYGFSDDRRL